MSAPARPPSRGSGFTTVLIVCVVVAFVVSVIAATAVAVLVEDAGRATVMIGLILAPLTSVLSALIVFAKVSDLDAKVGEVRTDTADLTNGLMDAKVRAAVADVLAPEYVDENARDQLIIDRARREHRPGGRI